tara:strand:- start:3397 stop:4482 length:1086 start_codon:yes stop_codon:yes gene_type:complete
MNKNFNIEVYKSFDESLKKIWKSFEQNSNNYCFQNYYWLKNWYEKFKTNEEIQLCIVIVYSKEIVCGILPFCIHKEKSIKFLKWMGGDQSDYMNGLFNKNFLFEKVEFYDLWNLIKKRVPYFDLTYFYNQPEYISGTVNPFIKNFRTIKSGSTNGIEIKNSFDEYLEKNLKRKFLSDTRRSMNQLNKRGKLEFKIFKKTDELDRVNFVKKILDNKIFRLNELKLKNNFNENIQEFYTNFNNNEFENGDLHISSLELDGKTLASHWGVTYKNIFYYLLPSIVKNELMRFSPGRILLYHLIKWCSENKIKKFDLTLGEESYKKEWSNSKISLYDFVEPNNLRSYPYYIYLMIKLKVKNFKKNL